MPLPSFSVAPVHSSPLEPPVPAIARPIDPRSQRILVFGDSMIHVLLPVLADYFHHNSHRLHAAIWLGSTSTGWAGSQKLSELTFHHHPTLAIAVVGSSEVFAPRAGALIAAAAKRLHARLAPARLVWIAPLAWRRGKVSGHQLADANRGVDAMQRALRDTLPPGRVFVADERGQPIGRSRDGIHPSIAGGKAWATAFIEWLRDESDRAIALEKPERTAPPPPVTRYGAAWLQRSAQPQLNR
ncbi:MAG: SGNH/GDSL hydrolase family protein [Myxococcota bacterium]